MHFEFKGDNWNTNQNEDNSIRIGLDQEDRLKPSYSRNKKHYNFLNP